MPWILSVYSAAEEEEELLEVIARLGIPEEQLEKRFQERLQQKRLDRQQ